ncbi:MAG: S41 family peptidase [bacterium]|nr:S41 family peptidase [bacterium]
MRRMFLVLLGAASGAVLSILATQPNGNFPPANAQSAHSSSMDRHLSLFKDVFEKVLQDYVDKPDDAKLVESAINGMLSGLDPHSSYMEAKSFRDMQTQTRGEFGGLGIEVTMESGLVKVVSPIDDSPAALAGIQAGDIITHLDDEPVQGLTLNQAVDKMRGTIGTSIKLKIQRRGQVINVTIVRAVVRVQSVKFRTEGDVGYIRITAFGERTRADLMNSIANITSQIPRDQLRGYILDLRNNPGGLLEQSLWVSDAFLQSGEEIVSTRGRTAEETQRFNARTKVVDLIQGKPLIVLINGGSASASEIVAGALQDHKRATILGTRSFGKGSVQTIIPLGKDKGALRLTTARYYTPSGRTIQAKGITPDIEVLQIEPEELKGKTDSKGEASLKGHLKVEGQEEGTGSQSYVPPKPEDDKALQMALELLRGTATNPAFPPKTGAPN